MKHNHDEVLNKVLSNMPSDNILCDLGDLFKLFGDTTRIKILYSLFESELSSMFVSFTSASNDFPIFPKEVVCCPMRAMPKVGRIKVFSSFL